MSARYSSRSTLVLRGAIRGLVSFLLLLGASSALAAQEDGDVLVNVVDEKGAPVKGVEVVITSEALPDFKKTVKTNKKGRFSVRFLYATHSYSARFTKEGFAVTDALLQPKVGGMARLTVTLPPEGAGPSTAAEIEKAQASDRAIQLFNEGVKAGREGDQATAEARLKAALEEDPELSQAHGALAILYYQEKRWPEALREVDLVLARDPRNATALRLRYEALRETGDEAGAAQAMQALEEVDPKVFAQSLVEQARLHFNQGEKEEAREYLRNALQRDPDSARAYYLLALCDLSDGVIDQGREHLERFLELAPEDPESGTARELLQSLE